MRVFESTSDHGAGSVAVSICPALTFSNFWTTPEGHRISTSFAVASPPRPDEQPLVAGREIPGRRVDGEVLRQARRGHDLHPAADPVAVRLRADGADPQPVRSRCRRRSAARGPSGPTLLTTMSMSPSLSRSPNAAPRPAHVLLERRRRPSLARNGPDSLRSSSGGCRYRRLGEVFSIVSITCPCATKMSFQPSLS